ncbi:MAG: hypothetical protein ACYDC1_05435 [Limisphaerales bacterium]
MRTNLLSVAVLYLTLATTAQSQPAPAPAGPPESTSVPSSPLPAGLSVTAAPTVGLETPPATEAAPLPPASVQMGGALPAIVRSEQPLQWLNPAAPPEYGDGTQFLSRNPATGEGEGVVLFSIKFFKKNPAKASAKPKKARRTKPAKD